MQDIQTYSNEALGATIHVAIDGNGDPKFLSRDVCAALDLKNPRSSVALLDDDEKGVHTVDTPGGKQSVSFVTEPGLYKLIMKSRKPEAKAFQRWVTHEVLPSIRRRGGYMVAAADETPEETMARALLIANDALKRKDARIAELEPKALFADAVAASDGTCLVGELAKMMRQNGVEIGQNRLFDLLREEGYLGKCGSNRNVPTQRAMEMGLFRIKETAVTHSDGHVTINRTPKVTGKGQSYFITRYCKDAS